MSQNPSFPAPCTLLVVDDEPEILATLAATFRRALPQAQVYTAGGAQEGLRLVAERDFDLVVSDHCMPGVTGLDFLARVRDLRPDTARVLMTGHPEMDVAIRGLNERILDRFLTKPFRSKEMLGTLTSLLDERRARLMHERAFARSFDVLRRQVAPGSP